jgi:hypothetical protein
MRFGVWQQCNTGTERDRNMQQFAVIWKEGDTFYSSSEVTETDLIPNYLN